MPEIQPHVEVVLKGRTGVFEGLLAARHGKGGYFGTRPDAQLSQAPECRQPRGAIAPSEAVNLRRRRHIDVFILAADDAPQIYAPEGLGGSGVAQLIEGDGDLGAPAAGIAAGPAGPDAIPGFVASAALV